MPFMSVLAKDKCSCTWGWPLVENSWSMHNVHAFVALELQHGSLMVSMAFATMFWVVFWARLAMNLPMGQWVAMSRINGTGLPSKWSRCSRLCGSSICLLMIHALSGMTLDSTKHRLLGVWVQTLNSSFKVKSSQSQNVFINMPTKYQYQYRQYFHFHGLKWQVMTENMEEKAKGKNWKKIIYDDLKFFSMRKSRFWVSWVYCKAKSDNKTNDGAMFEWKDSRMSMSDRYIIYTLFQWIDG